MFKNLSFFASILLLFICSFSSLKAQESKKPNVLLILLDDLNDNVGFMEGHPQTRTPNMDKLAAEGVIFENAHSNAPICAPSRSSLFTGIYPHVSENYGFLKWYNNSVLSNSKTLPRYLQENGYLSYGTGKLMHHELKAEYTEYGVTNYFGPVAFDGLVGAPHPSVPAPYQNIGLLDGTYASLADVPDVAANGDAPGYKGWYDTSESQPFRYVSDDDRDLLNDEKHAAWIADKIVDLDNSGTDDPFFLAVGFVRPHTPLVAPQKYFDMFPLETIILPEINWTDTDDTYYTDIFNGKNEKKGTEAYRAMSQSYPEDIKEGLKKYMQAYLACVAFVDVQVGKVLDALENSSFADNTIVILLSDHGYNHGQKETLFKNTLWNESTRVPLVIHDPRKPERAGARVKEPVSLVDIYPSVAEYCSLHGDTRKNNSGAFLSGNSLKPFVDNEKPSNWEGSDVALSAIQSVSSSLDAVDQNYSVRSRDWRYILYENGNEELYNHTNDPHEWVNLAGAAEHQAVKSALKASLQELLSVEHENRAPIINGQTEIPQFVAGQDCNIDIATLIFADTDSDDFNLKVLQGEGYSIISENTFSPDLDYEGTLQVLLQISDGEKSSEAFAYTSTIIKPNESPEIIRQLTIPVISPGDTLVIHISDIEVLDEDSNNFSISITPSDNYTFVNDSSLYISGDFIGDFNVNIQVSDGDALSPVFKFRVRVEPVLTLIETLNKFQIFPNPSHDHVFVTLPKDYHPDHLTLISLDGRIVKRVEFSDQRSRYLNTKGLSSGIYFFQIGIGADTIIKRWVKL